MIDKDLDFKKSQQKNIEKQVKENSIHLDTVDKQVKAAQAEQSRLSRRNDVTRYYIHTPLADADEGAKASAVKLELQVAAGPTQYKDDDGNIIYREGGSVILLEGEGVTTNKLWAEYLQREWPEFTITEIKSAGLSSYMQEIEEAKRDLELQEA